MARAVRWRWWERGPKLKGACNARTFIVLRDAGIAEKTQGRYYVALLLLLKFLTHPETTLQLDAQIWDWIQECWEQGESLHIVSDALCGLHH